MYKSNTILSPALCCRVQERRASSSEQQLIARVIRKAISSRELRRRARPESRCDPEVGLRGECEVLQGSGRDLWPGGRGLRQYVSTARSADVRAAEPAPRPNIRSYNVTSDNNVLSLYWQELPADVQIKEIIFQQYSLTTLYYISARWFLSDFITFNISIWAY